MAAHTNESGLDFVRSLVNEIKALEERLGQSEDRVTGLAANIQAEKAGREDACLKLGERISREVAAETEQRSALSLKLEDFERQVKTWTGALGVESKAARERLQALETTQAEHANAQAASDQRITSVEGVVQLKCPIADLERLSTKVAGLAEEVVHDRASAETAVKAARQKATCDFAEARARLDAIQIETMQLQAEINKKAVASDLISLQAKTESIQSDMQLRALITDMQGLDFRVGSNARALDTLSEELNRKPSACEVKAVGDRCTALSSQLEGFRTQARSDADAVQARINEVKHSLDLSEQKLLREIEPRAFANDLAPLNSSIETLNGSVTSIERRMESDRDRSQACWVALEKEVSLKAMKTDVTQLGFRLSSLEQSVAPLAPALSTKASVDDVHRVNTRCEALESGFATKADAGAFDKTRLALSNTQARHEELHGRSIEHNSMLQEVHGKTKEMSNVIEILEKRTADIRDQLPQKAHQGEVYAKAEVDKLLTEFYPKTEVDAMMSRVWWRVGQGKVGVPWGR